MKINFKNMPVIFQNNDFQTIQIKVYFPFMRNEQNLAKMHLLPGMLHNVCGKYPTEEEFSMECRKLFILANYCTCSVMGEIGYFCFNFMIPDTKYLEENLLEKQIMFLREMIYNPKIDNNGFCYDEFKREVDNLYVDMEKVLNDNVSYAMIHAKDYADNNGLFSSNIYNHKELIEDVNEKNLYDYYIENIYNNKPLVYIFGDVENTNINDLCKKYLYNSNFKNYSVNASIKNYLPIRDKVIEHIEKSNFKNSVLINFYKIKDMSYDDEVLLGTVKELLSSLGSRILNKKLRDEAELVYSSYAVSYNNYGILGIVSLIQKDNYSIVKKKINEALELLSDEDYITPLLQNIKDRHKTNLIRRLDDKTSLFQENIVNDLRLEMSPLEYYEKLSMINPTDITNFMSRIILDTSYFLEEGENE